MTVTTRILGVVWVLGSLAASAADDWKPAAGPLMTKWAKDVTPDKVLPEYPRPQLVRKDWTNLNGLWEYAIAPKAAAKPDAWQGKILVPFCVESALSGVMKTVGPENKLWYRRTFTRPDYAAGKELLLHFGAVDWETTVWVNGKEVGRHQGGFDPFTFNITAALKAEGENELIVSVWDPTDAGPQPRGKQVRKPGGIYYTPVTGIWQTVWLEAVRYPYVGGIKVTPDVDNKSVTVEVTAIGHPLKDQVFPVSVTVLDGQAEVATAKLDLGPGKFMLKVPNAKLWSDQSPFLYGLRVSAGTDTVESYFGMRKIEVKKDDKGVNRIYLNNQPIFMAGPLDQGFWPDGIFTAPTDEALKFDIEVTKQLGFNCTRKHVKVEPARWYYWCDKLGLIVWQDMPSGDKGVGPGGGEVKRTPEAAKIYEAELKAMIDALHWSPSIVMWVVFNEGWGQFDTVRISNWAKQYDPTRLINPASGWNDYPAGHVIDMHKYPQPGSPKPQPDRASVLGEYGGLGLPVPGHMWTKENWGYKGVADGKALTKQYVKMMAKVYQLRETEGLNAAIYTQITDVETEANGLLTYDRAVTKVDVSAVADANRGKAPPPKTLVAVAPSSEKSPQTWRYTTDKPADGWQAPQIDASAWKEGKGGFGTRGTPGAVVGTEWKTKEIWLRREFDVAEAPKNPVLWMHHDEDVEVFINGVLAARAGDFTTEYDEFDLTPEGRAAIKAGRNVIAVRCKQTTGGQYVDVGLMDAR